MRKFFVVLAAFFFAGFGLEAFSTEFVAEAWRSHHAVFTCPELIEASELSTDCILCHNDGGTSSDLNPYAVDIQLYKYDNDVLWTLAVAGVRQDDSDGDGTTNVIEINDDCTLPGDPLSVPNGVSSWSNVKALFR